MARVQRELKSLSVGQYWIQNGNPVFRLFSNTFRRRNLLLLKKSQHFLIIMFFSCFKTEAASLTFLFKIPLCTHACPDEGLQGTSCARHVRPRAWSWPSGFYSLLERCTISQNVTVHADTSPHTRVGLQMLEKLTKEAVSSSFEWPESFLTHPGWSLWDPTIILKSHGCLGYISL